MKAVFTTKVDPAYDDLPEHRYHFPRTYLRQADAAVGDWIVYYEPRRTSSDDSSRGGRQAYFATARVDSIEPDPTLPNHFYAFVSEYLEFHRAVPFKDGEHFYESGLRKADGRVNMGTFRRAVRTISDRDYELILSAGFAELIGKPDTFSGSVPGLAEDQEIFRRPLVERLVTRPFRDSAFAEGVKSAYDDTCAFTGLKIVNGGGRPEVQAAHIRGVAEDGPDSVRNGLALSGTIHWMFDRGLLSLDDDLTILKAKGHVPEPVVRLINRNGRLCAPNRPEMRPHPRFLRYHRENVFKG